MSTFVVPPGGSNARARRARWLSSSIAGLAIAAVAIGTVSPLAPPEAAAANVAALAVNAPEPVRADLLATPQIGAVREGVATAGVAWDQLVVGDTVFVGGDFSSARPFGAKRGSNESPRGNFLAYDVKTGSLRADVLPTFDGVVRALALSPDGKRLYVGGNFTRVDGKPRASIAAFDLSAGASPRLTLSESFVGGTGFRVQAIAATDSAVYVGGKFTTARRDSRIEQSWKDPSIVERANAAAFSAVDGSVLDWAPTVGDATVLNSKGVPFNEVVTSLVVSPSGDKVVLGGSFRTLNGSRAVAMGAVDASMGTSLLPWKVGSTVPTYDRKDAAMDDVAFTVPALASDGVYVYGVMFPSGYEGAFKVRWSDGAIDWLADCRGDTYSIYPTADVVYAVSHAHNCENLGDFPETGTANGIDGVSGPTERTYKRALAFTTAATQKVHTKIKRAGNTAYEVYTGKPAPSVLNWYPEFDTGPSTGQGPWDVTGAGEYVLIGGEFRTVDGTKQDGLARFARRGTAPSAVGPVLSGAGMKVAASARGGRGVWIGFASNYDIDDETLRYELLRDDSDRPVAQLTDTSRFFERRNIDRELTRTTLWLSDNGLKVGETHTYRVRTVDPDGNATVSDPVSYTATDGLMSEGTPYDRTVLDDVPSAYWPHNERSSDGGKNGRMFDWAGLNDLYSPWAPTRRGGGIEKPVAGSSAMYNKQYAVATKSTPSPREQSQELWVWSGASTGGQLMGFSWLQDSTSPSMRNLYMQDSGRVRFSPNKNASTLVSKKPLNDSAWHHIVATTGASGSRLYIDGVLNASSAATNASWTGGYWELGGHDLTGLPSAPTSNFFTGWLDNVAVYDRVLTPTEISEHHAAGSTAANLAPKASFTHSVTGLSITADASGSSDPEGKIASYAWDFGDGTSGTGPKPVKAYTKPGTYPVVLTVTDDRGATSTARATATVARVGSLAEDGFDRSASSGSWGTADQGGAWKLSGAASGFSVTDGRGVGTGAGARTAVLAGVSAPSSDSVVTFTLAEQTDKAQYVSVIGRQVGADFYSARAVVQSDGKLQLQLLRSGTALAVPSGARQVDRIVLPGTFEPGQQVSLRLEVSAPASGATTLRAMAWPTAGEAPRTWQMTATDSTAALQAAGSVGLGLYSAGASTVSFDGYRVTAPR